MLLSDFPKASLVLGPTPLEPMTGLTRALNGPQIFVKRDDCTGLAMGGNKVRQHEFYFGEALAEGADCIVSTSGIQSNDLRCASAAAAKLGLACYIQHENRVANVGPEYFVSGNVLLDRIFGAEITPFRGGWLGDDEKAANASVVEIAERLRADGRKPYVMRKTINDKPLGALGYVEAARELLDQSKKQGIHIDAIVTPSGTASTHAGLLVGLRSLGFGGSVLGVCVRRDAKAQAERVWTKVSKVADLLGLNDVVKRDDIWTTDVSLGSGYGCMNSQLAEAIKLAGRRDGLLVDPVYSGKALAGLIAMVREGVLKPDWNVVFVHTGGLPAVFSYQSLLDPHLHPASKQNGSDHVV